MTKTSELAQLFRALKAPAAARAVPALAERAREEEWSHERFLEAVLSTEVSSRESHGGENRIKAARFPARKTLEEFDFTFQRSLKKQVVEHLGQLDFLHGRENVVLLGPPGTGKTHCESSEAMERLRADQARPSGGADAHRRSMARRGFALRGVRRCETFSKPPTPYKSFLLSQSHEGEAMKGRTDKNGKSRRWRPGPGAPLAVGAVLIALALMLSGCGGGSSSEGGVATLEGGGSKGAESSSGSSEGAGGEADPLAFSKCMRAHGVKAFPDPNAEGAIDLEGRPGGELDPNSPTFQKAMKACQLQAPAANAEPSEEDKAKALEFSQCMRKNGVPQFPDPTMGAGQVESGPQTIEPGESGGGAESGGAPFDPESPTFKAALKSCEKYESAGEGPSFSTRGPNG